MRGENEAAPGLMTPDSMKDGEKLYVTMRLVNRTASSTPLAPFAGSAEDERILHATGTSFSSMGRTAGTSSGLWRPAEEVSRAAASSISSSGGTQGNLLSLPSGNIAPPTCAAGPPTTSSRSDQPMCHRSAGRQQRCSRGASTAGCSLYPRARLRRPTSVSATTGRRPGRPAEAVHAGEALQQQEAVLDVPLHRRRRQRLQRLSRRIRHYDASGVASFQHAESRMTR